MAQHHAVLSKDAKLGMGLQDANDPQEQAKREFELNRGHAVYNFLPSDRLLDLPSEDQAAGLAGVPCGWVAVVQGVLQDRSDAVQRVLLPMETSAVLMDKYGLDKGRIKIRWRIDLFPRFSGLSSSEIFGFVDANGDGVISSSEFLESQSRIIRQSSTPKVDPFVVEGISVYELDAKADITEHRIEVTNPSSAAPLAVLRELLPVRRSYVTAPNAFSSAAPALAAPSFAPPSFLAAEGKTGGSVAERGGAEGGPLAAMRKELGKNLPKTCKNDYDCNPGVVQLAAAVRRRGGGEDLHRPDDWKGGGLGALNVQPQDLATEPIPVRVEDGWIR
eukprot:CAMPEP_0177745864 /NCGR_PEP_ID=MMETSP0484_2-20121128/30545_1 /TAXON_ID=354590 /ORGANISM="Rhodomonas lens, Strain RHODO" /LENGTH=331 /DNA_ID=CAMNT_0019260539 /DNA_START=257 /DNA_END=1254 /DNA_ORIENTATION=-